jgi:hypothetical protein
MSGKTKVMSGEGKLGGLINHWLKGAIAGIVLEIREDWEVKNVCY